LQIKLRQKLVKKIFDREKERIQRPQKQINTIQNNYAVCSSSKSFYRNLKISWRLKSTSWHLIIYRTKRRLNKSNNTTRIYIDLIHKNKSKISFGSQIYEDFFDLTFPNCSKYFTYDFSVSNISEDTFFLCLWCTTFRNI
jgi:hypothetical protein